MKKSILVLVALLIAFVPAFAQDSVKVAKKAEVKSHLKQHFKPYGFIRNYFTYDSRECIAGTGDLYFYMPKDENWNQTEAEAAKMKGLADAEVMRAKGYTQKDVIDADVQKAYAEGLGNMGHGGDGGGGNLGTNLVGMMAGMKMANKMLDQMDGMPGSTGTVQAPAPVSAPEQAKWTCECGETENIKGFCMNCGKPRPSVKPSGDTKTCPACGETGITGRFCPNCGNKMPVTSSWNCPACGTSGITSNFCPDCGSKKPG